jgi:hypothetical protein
MESVSADVGSDIKGRISRLDELPQRIQSGALEPPSR